MHLVETRRRRSLFRCVVVLSLALASAALEAAECAAPQFRSIRDDIGASTGRGILRISVAPDQFTVDGLLCLTRTLKSEHPGWNSVIVLIFSSDEAAKQFEPDSTNVAPDLWRFRRDLRALYSLNRTNGEEYLSMTPLGIEGNDTRIDLPLAGEAHCRWEIAGRCILAMDQFSYPEQALKAGRAGNVLLTANADRAGNVAIVRTDAAVADAVLARAAAENLKKWWIEPAEGEATFQIVYSYVLDQSVPGGKVDVELALPAQVTIRAHPDRSQ